MSTPPTSNERCGGCGLQSDVPKCSFRCLRAERETARLTRERDDAARLYGTKEALDALRDRKTLESERAAWEKRAMEAEADWRRLRVALSHIKGRAQIRDSATLLDIVRLVDDALSGEPSPASETTGDGLSIDETRFLAALAGVKPPAGSPGGHTAYGRTLIERVWDEYMRLRASEKAPAHRAEDAAEQSERDMLARGRQASGEPR